MFQNLEHSPWKKEDGDGATPHEIEVHLVHTSPTKKKKKLILTKLSIL